MNLEDVEKLAPDLIAAFEEHYKADSRDPAMWNRLELWAVAWRAGQHALLCGEHLNKLAGFFMSGEEVEGPDGYFSIVADLEYWNEASEACDALIARIVPPEAEDDV